MVTPWLRPVRRLTCNEGMIGVAIDEKDLYNALGALGTNLANTLAANDDAREQRQEEAQQQQRQDSRRLRELDKLLCEYQNARGRRIGQMEHVVDLYFDKCSSKAIQSLEEDERMPTVINYRERYGALVATQDRSLMLRRTKATIAKAEQMLDETWGVQEAYADMFKRMTADLRKLGKIEVVRPQGDIEAQATISAAELSEEDLGALDDDFERMLTDIMIDDERLLDERSSDRAVQDELDEDLSKARRRAFERSRELAAEVAGAHIDTTCCDMASQPVAVEERYDRSTLKALAAEVRRSFERYSEVVGDNGLFAAFATDGGYGACRGFDYGFWWDDEHIWGNEYWGSNPHRFDSGRDIPDIVEEDDGGDTPERAVERMREFNQLEYWGYLDDEFESHIVAFWYGFKKLMVFANGRCSIDAREFEAQLANLRARLGASARVLGQRMDQRQVEEYYEAVQKLIEEL